MIIKSYCNGFEIILFLIIFFSPFGACAERRLALVIGNNDYQSVPVLNKAVNDAVAIGQTLKNLGFDVTLKENANQIIMDQAVSEFVLTISEGDIIVFYYAGHGVQLNNSNYLLPIDIKADKGEDVIRNSLELNSLLKKVSNAKAKLSLAIVDACRNNPFQSSATGRGIKKREIGKPRGLTSLTSAPHGVMVIYSAGIDEEALDSLSTDDNNPNGLFTREFIKVIRIPDLTIINIVSKVKQSVKEQAEKVGHQQHPAVYDETDGEFYFLIGPINDNSTISMIEPNKITPSVNPSMSNSLDERIFVDPASQPTSVQYKEVANRFRKQNDGTIYDSLLKKRWLMVDGIFEWEAACLLYTSPSPRD